MSIILLLLPLALVLSCIFLYLFITNARAGGFDDLDTPPIRILEEDRK